MSFSPRFGISRAGTSWRCATDGTPIGRDTTEPLAMNVPGPLRSGGSSVVSSSIKRSTLCTRCHRMASGRRPAPSAGTQPALISSKRVASGWRSSIGLVLVAPEIDVVVDADVGPPRVLHEQGRLVLRRVGGYRREVQLVHRRPARVEQHLADDVVAERRPPAAPRWPGRPRGMRRDSRSHAAPSVMAVMVMM